MRVAIIGGQNYDKTALETFLEKLQGKYPDVVIVTGNGRGAEQAVKEQAEAWGVTVEVPPLRNDLFGKHALDCQINDVLIGADAYVIVADGSRSKIALDWYKRMIRWLKPDSPSWRPIHTVAALPKAQSAAPRRRATKKQESLAA